MLGQHFHEWCFPTDTWPCCRAPSALDTYFFLKVRLSVVCSQKHRFWLLHKLFLFKFHPSISSSWNVQAGRDVGSLLNGFLCTCWGRDGSSVLWHLIDAHGKPWCSHGAVFSHGTPLPCSQGLYVMGRSVLGCYFLLLICFSDISYKDYELLVQ